MSIENLLETGRKKQTDGISEEDNIIQLLGEGEKTTDCDKQQRRQIALVLGNTGSGKSTFTQFITDKDDHLFGKDVGMNEYIIVDDDLKISTNSTLKSWTTYPESFYDQESNSILYDCPGFLDTRSAAHDIVAGYFTKKIVECGDKIKLLFVVNYSSVRIGVDRQDFKNLVNNAVTFIVDMDKFKNSIGLVVTKVDNNYIMGNPPVLINDTAIITNIIQFMQVVKQDFKDKLSLQTTSLDIRNEIENSIKFVNIFLEKKHDVIGIFRRPFTTGALSNSKIFQEEKKTFKNIIHKNIEFIQHERLDFQYVLSDNSRNITQFLVKKLHDTIDESTRYLEKIVQEHYQYVEICSFSLTELEKEFDDAHKWFTSFQNSITNCSGNIKELIEKISQITSLCPKCKNEHLEKINASLQFIIFFNDVGKLNERINISIENTLSNLEHTKIWYMFIKQLEKTFFTFEFHNNFDINKQKVQVLTPKSFLGDDHSSILYKDALELQRFLMNIMNNEFIAYNNKMSNVVLNNVKLNKLINILKFHFHEEKSCDEVEKKLTFKSVHLKLSDVIKYRDEECPNAKNIEVFALEEIFVNENFFTKKPIQLSIFAPKWEIIGKQVFFLNGTDAPNRVPETASSDEHHEYIGDEYTHRRRIDGLAGLPGMPGSNFFGIVDTFINADQLTIFAQGGKGGNGQNGEDGRPLSNHDHRSKRELITGAAIIASSALVSTVGAVLVCITGVKNCALRVGESGGHGGARGDSGMAGKIIFIPLDDTTTVKINNNCYQISSNGCISIFTFNGELGLPGKGGKGALGDHGKDGRDGISELNWFGFESSEINPMADLEQVINSYKNTLSEFSFYERYKLLYEKLKSNEYINHIGLFNNYRDLTMNFQTMQDIFEKKRRDNKRNRSKRQVEIQNFHEVKSDLFPITTTSTIIDYAKSFIPHWLISRFVESKNIGNFNDSSDEILYTDRNKENIRAAPATLQFHNDLHNYKANITSKLSVVNEPPHIATDLGALLVPVMNNSNLFFFNYLLKVANKKSSTNRAAFNKSDGLPLSSEKLQKKLHKDRLYAHKLAYGKK